MAAEGPPVGGTPGPTKGDSPRTLLVRWLLIAGAFALLGVWSLSQTSAAAAEMSYSEAVSSVRTGDVVRAEVHEREVILEMADAKDGKPDQRTVHRLPGVLQEPLLKALDEADVDVTGRSDAASATWAYMLMSLLPMLLIMFLLFGGMRAMRGMGGGGGALSFGKSQAKIHDESKSNPVTFRDVAGVDEARDELVEVVDFLRHPERYRGIGAHMPKGVLLVGAPGTGKTLLARAVAGEAGVPFFSITGSAFIEMFVGVGAARMRSLFEQAKARAPCIVFIDEIDSVGKSRGGLGAMGTHDEREQTLNQLLAELDGFEPNTGVVLMAATNRPEVLDAALLRAGRFDRQVVVERPDLAGRAAILAVHARKAAVGQDADLLLVARRTPGMVGADLARVVNEAALAAVRRGGDSVRAEDFDEAVDRIQLGLKKQGRAMTDDEKTRVAWHEAGHALVARLVEHADPVHRVSIIPRTIGALGVTLQLPENDQHLLTRMELLDRICVALGGRAAEGIAMDDISTGAENDLDVATDLARRMVARFGMSEALGPVSWERAGGMYLDLLEGARAGQRCSDQTARAIDEEVGRILGEQHARAEALLQKNRGTLDAIAEALVERETLTGADLDEVAGCLSVRADRTAA